MDYQAQQHKLLPPLAATFGFQLAADHLWNLYNTANNSMEQGDMELLPDVGALVLNSYTSRFLIPYLMVIVCLTAPWTLVCLESTLFQRSRQFC